MRSTRLHALDAFYESSCLAGPHPVGTVLGRAPIQTFICYHNCTVGTANDYPSFGRGIVMFGGSRVIGGYHWQQRFRVHWSGHHGWRGAGAQQHPAWDLSEGGRSETERNVVRDIEFSPAALSGSK
jgi:serine O-acetyltransferase